MMHPYATHDYALSLSHTGEPFAVPEWGGYVLKRMIDGSAFDAAGPYPLTILPENADIPGGLARLKEAGFVSAILVLDDFHRPTLEALAPHASLLSPYKTHYLYRPGHGVPELSEHHKRALKKGATQVLTEILPLAEIQKEWCALYDGLIAQLSLSGTHAFSHAHHEQIAKIQGFTAACGFVNGKLASCHVWAENDGMVMSHLVATSDIGYETRAGFVVNAASLEHFTDARVINFGGGAGNAENPDDGLARFKRGFANDTAKSYLCGFMLDEARYRSLITNPENRYFPAYR